MFHVPERCRVLEGCMASDASYGNNGAFRVVVSGTRCVAIASDGMGWEHVSVRPAKAKRTLTWEEMAAVKDLFWDEEDCVVQYHPPKSEHVNCHPYALHLWRPTGEELPRPPSILVGPR